MKYIEVFVMVLWISVYDFDERSRIDGLFFMFEDKIKC